MQRIDRSSQDGRGDPRDRNDSQERQLKAGFKQRSRIHQQNSERRHAQRIQPGAISEQQTGEQVNIQRDGRPHDRRTEVGDERITPGEKDCQDCGPGLAERQAAQQPEDCKRQDADIDSGDDEDVIRSGPLEVRFDLAAKERTPTNESRLHQRSRLARPKLIDVLQRAAPC